MNKDNNQNKGEKNLIEQTAPEKNTDHAFVQVGRDGGPVIPQKASNENRPNQQNEEEQRHS